MEANQQYLLDKHRKTDNKIETLREYAEQNAVPIVDRLSLEMIKQLNSDTSCKNILEIGTAIGYSSMQFASVSNDIHITTIERDEEMITQAKSNFETYGYSSQIRLIEEMLLEQYNEVNDKQYDIIFIDAAKAQSKKFLNITHHY